MALNDGIGLVGEFVRKFQSKVISTCDNPIPLGKWGVDSIINPH